MYVREQSFKEALGPAGANAEAEAQLQDKKLECASSIINALNGAARLECDSLVRQGHLQAFIVKEFVQRNHAEPSFSDWSTMDPVVKAFVLDRLKDVLTNTGPTLCKQECSHVSRQWKDAMCSEDMNEASLETVLLTVGVTMADQVERQLLRSLRQAARQRWWHLFRPPRQAVEGGGGQVVPASARGGLGGGGRGSSRGRGAHGGGGRGR